MTLRRRLPVQAPYFASIPAFLLLAIVVLFVGLVVPDAGSLARPSAQLQLRALALPPSVIDATTDKYPRPLVSRSLRLAFGDRDVVLVSGENDVEEIEEGHVLGMSFEAVHEFRRVGALLTSWGTEGSVAAMLLKNADGKEVAQAEVPLDAARTWASFSIANQPPGRYTLEITKRGLGRLGWIGRSVPAPPRGLSVMDGGGVAFRPGEAPQYANSSLAIPAGFRAEALYFLGGLSTYDRGMSWWDDYDVRADFGDRQFVGDSAGSVEIVYDDGSLDSIPLVFGWNMWWYNHFDGPEAGGPFLEPFLSDAAARATLEESLRLANFSTDTAARYFWTYLPRPKKIKEIRLVDNPDKQGFPSFSAISVLTGDDTGNLIELDRKAKTALPKDSRPAPITPSDLKTASYRQPVERLKRTLYTMREELPSSVPVQPSSTLPQLEFYGPAEAGILSNVFAANVPDLLAKQDTDGKFHASGKGSINWGSYQGIGTWRPGAGPFYNQSWARDMGRALLEFARLGFLAKTEAGVQFVDSHLYDLPSGYPVINRDGQKVPAHWTTVIGEPLYGDADGKGDGAQANDGHGLLLLAHYRLWQQKGEDADWLRDRWPFVRDAAEWFVFQLDNPAFSRSAEVLFTESESSKDAGYDVYSNYIAMKALEKASSMAASLGEAEVEARWQTYATRLKSGILNRLTVEEPQFGKAWKPTAWNWSYAHESLGPIILTADVDGLDLETMDRDLISTSLNTYRRQISYPTGPATPQTLGYGQAFLTQAALLADDVDTYTKALNNLARFIYYPHNLPYLVPEGVTMHPSGEYWYRNGDLGNAVHQAEVLKVLSIVAGVDNLRSGEVGIMPRPPDGWTGMKVAGYPANGGKATVSYILAREASSYRLSLRLSGEAGNVRIRLGPLPGEAKEIRVAVDGKPSPSRIIHAGQRTWVWLDKLVVESDKETIVQIDWAGG